MVLAALTVFAALGSMPQILKALHLVPVAATSVNGVKLLQAPPHAGPVSLPPVAQPVQPDLPPATAPAVSLAHEASIVSFDDNRIRQLLHDAVHVLQPTSIRIRGSLRTLVLPPSPRAYTAADLAAYGALVMEPDGAAQLLRNVYLPAGARLSLGAPTVRTIYMDDTSSGFTSIVAWGGSLSFTGTPGSPLKIIGWDPLSSAMAVDQGNGRPYIREIAGAMTLAHVQASGLGFWSGRTGGVSWTGVSGTPSTGGAHDSTFTSDLYGAFISRSQSIAFTDDRFELNELDGLHIHRNSVGTVAASSSASRNGGNGFVVQRATSSTTLQGDVSEHNAGNGYFVDGRPLVTSASASGGSVTPGSNTVIENSSAISNARTGILVEGGTGTVLKADQVCAKITAIAVRSGATNAVLTGNNILCGPRSGFSIGPAAPGTTLSGNAVTRARIGMFIRAAGSVVLDDNRITGGTVFGVSVRGAGSDVTGVGNVISGNGFRAVDARAGAVTPPLKFSVTTGWVYRGKKLTFWTYLQFHPLAMLWLSILAVVILAFVWSRRRRLPPHPYPASTRWRGMAHEVVAAQLVPDRGPAPQRSASQLSSARHAVAVGAESPVYPERSVHREPTVRAEPSAFPEPAVWPTPSARPEPHARPEAEPWPERTVPPARPVWPEPAAEPEPAVARAFIEPAQAPPPERFQAPPDRFATSPPERVQAQPEEWFGPVPPERFPAQAERFEPLPAEPFPASRRGEPPREEQSRPEPSAAPPWETTPAQPVRPGRSTGEGVEVTRPLPKVVD
jgi:hypothetical protein